MNKKRQVIWDKSNGHCWYCGMELGETGWHIDHLEPVFRNVAVGGFLEPEKDNDENKVPACASCNLNKHSLSLEEWREVLEGYVNSLNRDSTPYRFAKRYGLIEEIPKRVTFWFEENIQKSTAQS